MTKVRIREVAEHAGVALGTVSHYLNHPERVSDEKAQRIKEAIDELGFVPNIVGRQLRLGESDVIAYIAPEVSNPFFSTVAEGIEQEAIKLGLSVFVANSHHDRAREDGYLSLFERYRVRGIVAASFERIEDRLERVRRRGTAAVLLGQRAAGPNMPSVSVDEVAGGRLAGEHLLGLGRRRIAFVGGPVSIRQVRGRLDGVAAAVAEVDGASLEIVDVAERTIPVGRLVGQEFAARPREARPDAIFAVNDLLALGVLQTFGALGIDVPGEIAVIGYDDIEFAEASVVPLSSVRTRQADFGAAAVNLLAAAWANQPAGHVVFQPALVPRASTLGGRS
jgi:LacI family transcriptional regulator